jgi:hypothetical protein
MAVTTVPSAADGAGPLARAALAAGGLGLGVNLCRLGYRATRTGDAADRDFEPEACLAFRLSDQAGKVLTEGLLVAGPTSPLYDDMLFVRVGQGHRFADAEALRADPARASAGLLAATETAAAGLAQFLAPFSDPSCAVEASPAQRCA